MMVDYTGNVLAGSKDCASTRWAALEATDADSRRIKIRRHWTTSDIG
jgi:hypothetical protein